MVIMVTAIRKFLVALAKDLILYSWGSYCISLKWLNLIVLSIYAFQVGKDALIYYNRYSLHYGRVCYVITNISNCYSCIILLETLVTADFSVLKEAFPYERERVLL